MNIQRPFLRKLLAGFGITGLITVAIFLCARSTLLDAVDLIDETLHVRVERLARINHLQSLANKIRIVESELPKIRDVFAITGAVHDLYQDLNALDEELLDFARELDPAPGEIGDRLTREWRLYLGDLERTVHAVQNRNFASAERASTFYSRPRFQTFSRSLREVSARIERRAQTEHRQSLLRLEEKRRVFLWLSLAGILTGIVFALLLARSLSGRIQILRKGALLLARGDLEQPITVGGRDEVADLAEAFNAMQRQVRQRTTELAERETRFRSLVETTSDWIWEIDAEARYTYASPKVCDLLQIDPQQVLGRTVFELMTDDGSASFGRDFLDSMKTGRSFQGLEKVVHAGDGSRRVMESSGVPIFGDDGTLYGFRGIDRDVTARKAAEEALQRAHCELERRVEERTAELAEANRELDAFACTLSHDLRTPIGTIGSIANFFQEHYGDRLDAEATALLIDIEKQCGRMLELMEDLLELARIGEVERPSAPVDADAVVAQVVDSLHNSIDQAPVAITRIALPSLRVPKTLLYQMFDNLINNAVRYGSSPKGDIEVGGFREGKRIRFFVRDHGPGVSESERERIFSVFYRGEQGKRMEGTGIGLATVAKIARLFDGRAWVEETPGGGATFWVEMFESPPQKADRPAACETPSAEARIS